MGPGLFHNPSGSQLFVVSREVELSHRPRGAGVQKTFTKRKAEAEFSFPFEFNEARGIALGGTFMLL